MRSCYARRIAAKATTRSLDCVDCLERLERVERVDNHIKALKAIKASKGIKAGAARLGGRKRLPL